MNKKIVFGPVPSRRLGWSLGVDLVPYKRCSLDCIYCEVGKTTDLTIKKCQTYAIQDILFEIEEVINQAKHVDYITFSGSGEPTLYDNLAELIQEIKTKFPLQKIALLTNSTLINNKDVFNAALLCDLVLPSVDSVTDTGFQKINRPHKDLDLKQILSSLIDFRKNYKGQLWVEVFIVEGINDTDFELNALVNYLKILKADKIQINTLDRPGTESWVKSLSIQKLKKILSYFKELPVEVISKKLNSDKNDKITNKVDYSLVLETLKIRGLTTQDIINMTGEDTQSVLNWLSLQEANGFIKQENDAHWVCRKYV